MKQRQWIILALLSFLALSAVWAGNRNTYPLPEDRGTAGTLAALEKLPVYTRVLHTIAHPDDESSGTLTWLSRKFHAETALYCLTRGEGGQNILGKEKYDALGMVRTGELLEACRYYGTNLYFGSVLDFGFSKTGEETLSKWGYEATLEELVRFIRTWRPTIIISRFQGSPADGHGHHQASGILTREAFRAAGDPEKYPEQIRQGLSAWQAKKLFVSARMFGKALPRDDTGGRVGQNPIVRIPVGDYDPVLGRSYREIASEGYSKHRTQGTGTAYSSPGQAYEYYALADSVIDTQQNEGGFFDSIDASLTAIADLAGDDEKTIPFLRKDLMAIQEAAAEALRSFEISNPEKSATAITKGTGILRDSISKIELSPLSRPQREILTDALNGKLQDFHEAMHRVLGISLNIIAEDATAVPGEKEPFTLTVYNRGSEKILIRQYAISTRLKGGIVTSEDDLQGNELPGGSSASAAFLFEIPPDANITEPFWKLKNSGEARYTILPTLNRFAPFGPPEIEAELQYVYQEEQFSIRANAMAQGGDPLRGSDFIDFQIVPALSVDLDPETAIAPIGPYSASYEFRASVQNNLESGAKGSLKLISPAGWRVEPEELSFNLSSKGDTFTAKFALQIPPGARSGAYEIEAVATMEGKQFHRGHQVVSYTENWTQRVYDNARSRLERFQIEVAPNLTVGYVSGAGDDIPSALEQLGVKVQMLSAENLAFGDLNRFSVIVTGIRAYNVNEGLRANNQRLLDFVENGGILIVQYVRPMGRRSFGSTGSEFAFSPYPMRVSNSDRITVEDSPIRILDPTDPLFNLPNKITEADFQGWIQERGLYFMNSWDPRYKALLSGSDPGEESREGGMLYTRYGKGHYIYTGYSWFRQLPAGIPGAFRIFANMLSLGHYSQ